MDDTTNPINPILHPPGMTFHPGLNPDVLKPAQSTQPIQTVEPVQTTPEPIPTPEPAQSPPSLAPQPPQEKKHRKRLLLAILLSMLFLGGLWLAYRMIGASTQRDRLDQRVSNLEQQAEVDGLSAEEQTVLDILQADIDGLLAQADDKTGQELTVLTERLNSVSQTDCVAALCVLRQASSPGTQQEGNINIDGDIISASLNATTVTALNLVGNGASVTNVDAITLEGNNTSYFTDASNISTGTLSVARGGTGLDGSAAGNGQLLIGNGSGYSLATITAGAGISVTNGAGAITIASTGAAVACDNTSNYICNGGNSTGAALTVGTNDAFALVFETGGTSKMTIGTTGAVTINNATSTSDSLILGSPTVYGSNFNDGIITIYGEESGVSGHALLQSSGTNFFISSTNQEIMLSPANVVYILGGKYLQFYDSTNAVVSSINQSSTSTLSFTLTNNVNALNIDSNTLTVDALNNRVGIGTTTPLSALNVAGTTPITWASGSNSFGLATIGTGGTSGGSLWVNTPSLNATYHSGLAVDGSYTNPGGIGTSVVNLKALGVNSPGGYDSALTFYTSLGATATEKMRITSVGYVGIGDTSPDFKLELEGTASVTDRKIGINGVQVVYLPDQTAFAGSIFFGNGGTALSHTAGSEGYYNTGLGIGALSSVTTGASNTAVGVNALVFNSTGGNNTAMGRNALYTNTSGSTNSAFGDSALFSNTTGSNNTASGYAALYSNTTGSANTANGYHALYSNTTGSSNTATGNGALYSNTTGLQNSAIGYQALYSNTTGNFNTASGLQALYLNTTGAYNTATGTVAMHDNTTGNYNTANGMYALYSNTTGSNNTAVGYSSLRFNTTGSENTANGYLALSANTTGVNNTATGRGALENNTTGNYNTANGYSALVLNTSGHSNTATGFQALYFNTTGANNTATGRDSLQRNTTGSNNTANGTSALFFNTTGSYNVANGYQALYANTIGNSNSAFGNAALYDNTTGNLNTANGSLALRFNSTGNNNTAIGYASLYSNTTGTSNTASGTYALYSNTTGDNSTANGYSALFANTTGSNNTANGYQALYSNTTGNDNVAFGRAALFSSTTGTQNSAIGQAALSNVTTGSNNTAIGYNTGLGITTGSHNTILGANVTGLAAGLSNNIIIADGQGNQRINVGSTGNVGIGDTTPDSLFTVGASDAFQVNSFGNMVMIGDVAHSISNSSGNLVVQGNDKLHLKSAAGNSAGIILNDFVDSFVEIRQTCDANPTPGTRCDSNWLNVIGSFYDEDRTVSGSPSDGELQWELNQRVVTEGYSGRNGVIQFRAALTNLYEPLEINQLIRAAVPIQITLADDSTAGNLSLIDGQVRIEHPGVISVRPADLSVDREYFNIVVDGDSQARFRNQLTTDGDLLFDFGNGSSTPTEKVRFTSAGRVGIGETAPGVKLTVKETTDTNVLRLQDTDGTCDLNPESGAITTSCSSDERLKSNIRDAASVLSEIKGLKVHDYTITASGNEATGLIAQEVIQTNPDMVHLGEDGYYKVDSYNPWKMLKGIQELSANADNLQTTFMTALEETNGNLVLANEGLASLGLRVDTLSASLEDFAARLAEHDERIQTLEDRIRALEEAAAN